MRAGASLRMVRPADMPEPRARELRCAHHLLCNTMRSKIAGLGLGAAVQGLSIVFQVGVRHGARGEVGTKPSQGFLAHLPIE
jgi:hypothetical protein